ncbi:polysaccharide lyase [Tahibacter amnicola]|uniref:Polysaccharide lyase n=1 Tax=Tahibacter amnicola TaxID=2976241 RepID=A0ABY6BFY3_9GAMM|nr:polysaccharide lyase [Tahibacter amnicola]UXI66777.1 polysaccharide lyase [Tahibacter amnicola]
MLTSSPLARPWWTLALPIALLVTSAFGTAPVLAGMDRYEDPLLLEPDRVADPVFPDGFEAIPGCSESVSGGGWSNYPVATQTGSFTARFNATPSQNGIDALVGLSNGAQTAFTGLAAIVAFDSTGHITARNGGVYPASTIPYSAGSTYYFRLDVHVSTKTYSVYVTSPGGSEQLVGANYAFRTEQANVSQLTNRASVVAGTAGRLRVCNFTVSTLPVTHVQYGYLPPIQYVGGGMQTSPVPAGRIHQTAWDQSGGPDIVGVYTHDYNGWKSLVWRWADTMRSDAIRPVSPAPGTTYPAYRFELAPWDHASPGTAGDHPRAEFFSVDPAEDRRQRVPPRENIIRQGDEYWATFALYLAPDFPLNHRWATLVQRKFQNGLSNPSQWFSVNAHMNKLDYQFPRGISGDYKVVANISDVRGRWIQFTIHEKASSNSDGLFEVYVNGQLHGRKTGPTLDPGDINYNFHLGYYRANEPANGQTSGPGVGVVYETPLLIWRGPNPGGIATVPALP